MRSPERADAVSVTDLEWWVLDLCLDALSLYVYVRFRAARSSTKRRIAGVCGLVVLFSMWYMLWAISWRALLEYSSHCWVVRCWR